MENSLKANILLKSIKIASEINELMGDVSRNGVVSGGTAGEYEMYREMMVMTRLDDMMDSLNEVVKTVDLKEEDIDKIVEKSGVSLQNIMFEESLARVTKILERGIGNERS